MSSNKHYAALLVVHPEDLSYLTHADRSISHAFEGFIPPNVWLLLQHILQIRGGQFDPEYTGQFPPESVVSLKQNQVVKFNGISSYTEDFAKRVFRQLEGFGSYGFPESHAASFALLVYVSCWLKCYYPDVFATALLNSMPMGFYQPAQIVIDARKHGVEVREVDINISYWDNIMQERSGKFCAVRLGFRQIKGLREEDMQTLVERRGNGFNNIHSLLDAGVPLSALERLADADAFRSIGLDRRQALWEVSALSDRPVALFEGQPSESSIETQIELPLMSKGEHVIQDYASAGLSLKAHPVSFVREKLRMLHVKSAKELEAVPDGQMVKVAGLVLVRQRPGTAAGVCFITIEDETGNSNLVVWEKLFEKYRKEILQSRLLMVEGKMQREGEVVHIVAQKCFNLTGLLKDLTSKQDDHLPVLTLSRSDERSAPYPQEKRSINPNNADAAQAVFSKGRNFR